jgi:hypothetical protein
MCGSASTSVLMKSSCDPSIIAAIITEKPTPVMTPMIATMVCRARWRTWVQAMVRIRFMARPAR